MAYICPFYKYLIFSGAGYERENLQDKKLANRIDKNIE